MPKNTTNTADRFIYFLKYFLEKKEITLDNAIIELNKKQNTDISCNETILKYINTLKDAGFGINKHKNKYQIISLPSDLKLAYDANANNPCCDFENIPCEAKSLLQLENLLRLVFELKTTKDHVHYEENDRAKMFLKECKKLCKDKQRLEIDYFNGEQTEQIMIEPQGCANKSRYNYIYGYDIKNEEMRFCNFELIQNIKQLPLKSQFNYERHKVTLKIKGKLAKSYTLRAKELITQKTSDFIVVETSYKDKRRFLKRISRYGANCEILAPMSLKETFKQELSLALAQYN